MIIILVESRVIAGNLQNSKYNTIMALTKTQYATIYYVSAYCLNTHIFMDTTRCSIFFFILLEKQQINIKCVHNQQ